MKLAVIPARSGSKRIPRKNIRPFAGRPMIAWSIGAAVQSGLFDRVIVSTDDEDIAQVSRSLGAEAPFLRPAHLSDDHTPTVPVVAHAIEWLRLQGSQAQQVCCIYATAPFITTADLQLGAEILRETGCDYAFSVTTFAFPIQRALRMTAKNRVAMFNPEHLLTRSQDLESAYHDAGQFYWGRAEAWLSGSPIFGENSAPVVLPRHRVQDIDTAEDWVRAELMFNALKLSEST